MLGFNGSAVEMTKMEAFVQLAELLPLTDNVVLQTIALRKARRIKMPDAIIGATALVNNLQLLSRNVSDFKNIVGLTVVNPYAW